MSDLNGPLRRVPLRITPESVAQEGGISGREMNDILASKGVKTPEDEAKILDQLQGIFHSDGVLANRPHQIKQSPYWNTILNGNKEDLKKVYDDYADEMRKL